MGKKRKHWEIVKEFLSEKDAIELIEKEDMWSRYYSNQTNDGKKTYYRCSKSKYRDTQCEAAIHLVYDPTCSKVRLYQTTEAHTHEENGEEKDISEEVKAEIKELYELNLKCRAIMLRLAQKELKVPSENQINYQLRKLRIAKFGRYELELSDVISWAKSHEAVPDDDNSPFVLSYDYDAEKVDASFRLFVTTKALLGLALKTDIIHADGTYKLIWQGYPVLMVGTSDCDRKYHPFGLIVSTNETAQDYEFVFQSLKTGLKRIFNYDFSAKTLICDAAHAIHNGFRETYGKDVIVIMCWAHMKRAVSNKAESLVSSKINREKILADIDRLQLCYSTETFNKGANLFLKKWQQENEFCRYFKNEWIFRNRNWFEGIQLLTPSTNNCLESANNLLKKQYTFRERLDLSHFLHVMLKTTTEWSQQYQFKIKEFAGQTTIDLKLWTAAYHWAKLNVEVAVQDKIFYQIPASGKNIVLVEDAIVDPFNSYMNKIFSHWTLKIPGKEDWIKSECNCPAYLKNYMCKHILGMAIRLKYAEAPLEAKLIPLGQKRRPGRPAKSKKALIKQ